MPTVKRSPDEVKAQARVDRDRLASLSDDDIRRFAHEDGTDFDLVAALPKARVVRPIDVAGLRKRLGLSQSEFAERFGFSRRTLQEWEQHRREPTGPSRVLLTVIDFDPGVVEKALERD